MLLANELFGFYDMEFHDYREFARYFEIEVTLVFTGLVILVVKVFRDLRIYP